MNYIILYYYYIIEKKNKNKTKNTDPGILLFLLYGGTLPYGHLVATFFWLPGKNRHTFSCKKALVNTATPLIRRIFLAQWWPY